MKLAVVDGQEEAQLSIVNFQEKAQLSIVNFQKRHNCQLSGKGTIVRRRHRSPAGLAASCRLEPEPPGSSNFSDCSPLFIFLLTILLPKDILTHIEEEHASREKNAKN